MVNQQLRVLSFNLNRNAELTRRCVKHINDGNGDFFLLQEYNEHVGYFYSNCYSISTAYNHAKDVSDCFFLKREKLAIVASKKYQKVAEVPIPSNCSELQAILYKSTEGLFIGVINVCIKRLDGNPDILRTLTFPNLMNCIHSLKYGFLNETGRLTPRANVIIFGGDTNAVNEDFVDYEFMRRARPALRQPYYDKSSLLRSITQFFNIGTSVRPSESYWTCGLHLFYNNLYIDTVGRNHSLKLELLRENYEAFLSWRGEHGHLSDLSLVQPNEDEMAKLREYGFGSAISFPCFKYLHQHFLTNDRTFRNLTLEHFFTIRNPGWIDRVLYSNNCKLLYYGHPTFLLDDWPRHSDHRLVEAVIEIVSAYSDELTGFDPADVHHREFRTLIRTVSEKRIECFKTFLNNEDHFMNVTSGITLSMP